MEYSLDYILSPISFNEFSSEIYTKKSVLIKGEEDKFKGLFSFSDLNQILNTSPIPHPTLKLVKEATPIFAVNSHSIVEACKNGASLIINELHKYNSNVGKLTSVVSTSLNEPTQVNMYLGQPDIRGFNNHYDCHDVFIIQTEGYKRWRVYKPTLDFPLFIQKTHPKTHPEKPYLDCVLSPGDLLYIPRGHWHEAIATTKPSLHLTLGISAKTGIDFLNWLSDELRECEVFRKPFPLISGTETNTFQNHDLWNEHLSELKEKLIEKLTTHSLIADYLKSCISKDYNYEPFNLPYQFQKETISLLNNGSLTRNSFQSFMIDRNGATIDLISSGKVITFKNSCESLINFLMKRGNITFLEINEQDFNLSKNQTEQVINCLIKEGIIKYSESEL